MGRSNRRAGIVIAAAAAIAVVASTGGNAQTPGSRTVTFFEDGSSGTFAFIDNPPHSPVANPDSPKARFSLGDQAAFSERLLDRAGGRAVGRVFATETVVAGSRFPRVTNLIHAVFRLQGGQIVVDAAVDERHPEKVRAAVTGGTGVYEGARGTFTTSPGKTGNSDQIVLLP
jgi:phytoene dehydrogenase-like protein